MRLLKNLFEKFAEAHCRKNHHDEQNEARHNERELGAQPELHGHYSASARSPPYSFSLLCRVLRLIPRSSAARVLLLPVAPRVCRMSSRSIASTVVPTGNLIAERSLGPLAPVFPNSPGRHARVI